MSIAPQPKRALDPARGVSLPRAARLLKPSDFTKVFKNNEASTDALFRVLWRSNDQAVDRLGMAISRKVDRRAVGRNRIKRIVRERFRHWRADHTGAAQHYDVVILARPAAAAARNAALGQSLDRHWQRIQRARDGDDRSAVATRKLN